MVKAHDHDFGLGAVGERDVLGLGTIELSVARAEMILFGDLDGAVLVALLGDELGDLRDLVPRVVVEAIPDFGTPGDEGKGCSGDNNTSDDGRHRRFVSALLHDARRH